MLIGGSDIPAYQRLSLVTVDLLQSIGFKVDLQLTDWGSVATRRQKKDPPAQGGWNLFHTSANGAQLASPLTSPSTITTCDGKNFPGWPCDRIEEDMRLRYIREPDAAKRAALCPSSTVWTGRQPDLIRRWTLDRGRSATYHRVCAALPEGGRRAW